jgi:hypothetical protein
MLLTFNYFLIDVKQILYLLTLFAAEPEVMGTLAKLKKTRTSVCCEKRQIGREQSNVSYQ